MHIIQKLQSWFTKSNEPSKQQLLTQVKELEEKLERLQTDYADVTDSLNNQIDYTRTILSRMAENNVESKEKSKTIEHLQKRITLNERDKKRLKKTIKLYAKDLSELEVKYKFLLKDHALMEDRYKDFSHLLSLPFAIRQNMIADYKRSYIEAVNYVGGTHVFKS